MIYAYKIRNAAKMCIAYDTGFKTKEEAETKAEETLVSKKDETDIDGIMLYTAGLTKEIYPDIETVDFEEKYVDAISGNTIMYFKAAKEFLHGKYPEAESMEIKMELPTDYENKLEDVMVSYSPTKTVDDYSEDYDWYDVELTTEAIEALLQVEKDHKDKETLRYIMHDNNGNYGFAYVYHAEEQEIEQYAILLTPENTARFIAKYGKTCKKIVVKNPFDLLVVETIGVLLAKCPYPEFCRDIVATLAPIHKGEAEIGEVVAVNGEYAVKHIFEDKPLDFSMLV